MCPAGGFLSRWGWGKDDSRQTSTGVHRGALGTLLERDLKVISPRSLINNWKERQWIFFWQLLLTGGWGFVCTWKGSSWSGWNHKRPWLFSHQSVIEPPGVMNGGLLDSFLVNKAEGWPLDFFLIKRKQGFLVVSGAAPEVWLFFLEGIFVKVVCRPRSDPGACPGWACRDSFCSYSKARRGEISEPCGPGKVENSDQSLLYPRHPKLYARVKSWVLRKLAAVQRSL